MLVLVQNAKYDCRVMREALTMAFLEYTARFAVIQFRVAVKFEVITSRMKARTLLRLTKTCQVSSHEFIFRNYAHGEHFDTLLP